MSLMMGDWCTNAGKDTRTRKYAHKDRQRGSGFEGRRGPAAASHRSAEERHRSIEEEVRKPIHSFSSLVYLD